MISKSGGGDNRPQKMASMGKMVSNASVYFEQLQQDIKQREQVTLAQCDKIIADRGKGASKKAAGTMSEAVSGTEAIRTWNDHMIPTEKLAEKFDTNHLEGLTDGKAKAKHQEYGDNALTKKEVKPWYCVFFEEMTGFFSLLLWFGSALCFIGYAI